MVNEIKLYTVIKKWFDPVHIMVLRSFNFDVYNKKSKEKYAELCSFTEEGSECLLLTKEDAEKIKNILIEKNNDECETYEVKELSIKYTGRVDDEIKETNINQPKENKEEKIMPETKKEVKSEATCDYEAVVKSLTEQVENLQKENAYIKEQYQALVVDYNRQVKMSGRWFDELERLETAIKNAQRK